MPMPKARAGWNKAFLLFPDKFSGFPWGFLLPPGHSLESHSPRLDKGFVKLRGWQIIPHSF